MFYYSVINLIPRIQGLHVEFTVVILIITWSPVNPWQSSLVLFAFNLDVDVIGVKGIVSLPEIKSSPCP